MRESRPHGPRADPAVRGLLHGDGDSVDDVESARSASISLGISSGGF